METLSLRKFKKRIVVKIHRRVGSNTMIHFYHGPYQYESTTLCGIEIDCPVRNIDDYDDRTIVDKNGIIVTGFGWHTDCPEPTCAECSRIKQMLSHHCSVHGYLKGREVTFDEKCDYCGNAV